MYCTYTCSIHHSVQFPFNHPVGPISQQVFNTARMTGTKKHHWLHLREQQQFRRHEFFRTSMGCAGAAVQTCLNCCLQITEAQVVHSLSRMYRGGASFFQLWHSLEQFVGQSFLVRMGTQTSFFDQEDKQSFFLFPIYKPELPRHMTKSRSLPAATATESFKGSGRPSLSD